MAGITALAIASYVVVSAIHEWNSPPSSRSNNDNPTDTTQPTSTSATPPTSPPQPTPTNPPRALTGREARILDRRGLSVDTSSESYPKSYLVDGRIADSVVTTVGHSEARSISDNENQKM